jgi:hypothetical protein
VFASDGGGPRIKMASEPGGLAILAASDDASLLMFRVSLLLQLPSLSKGRLSPRVFGVQA